MSLSLPPKEHSHSMTSLNTGSASCKQEYLAEFLYARHWHTTRDDVASSFNYQFITQG